MIDVNTILFRCHTLGKLNTKTFGVTAQEVCVNAVAQSIYGRKEEKTNKYCEKGTMQEEAGITLYSRVTKKLYKKNTERLTNEYLTGELDLFTGKSASEAEETADIKCSYSLFTFLKAKGTESKDYKDQGHGYMGLSGSKRHTVAYCLVNGTAKQIIDEKRRLAYSMDVIDPYSSPEYIEKCKQIEINHIFNLKEFFQENPGFELDNDPDEWKWDIPLKDRVHSFSFDRDENEIQKIYARVREARKWISENIYNEQLQIA